MFYWMLPHFALMWVQFLIFEAIQSSKLEKDNQGKGASGLVGFFWLFV